MLKIEFIDLYRIMIINQIYEYECCVGIIGDSFHMSFVLMMLATIQEIYG